MKHLNDSFEGVEEAIIKAIRLLGVSAMGIDAGKTRMEALDQLAIALECLETGQGDVGADGTGATHPAEPRGSTETSEKQPEAHSVRTENGETGRTPSTGEQAKNSCESDGTGFDAQAKLFEKPTLVDGADLERLADALGEIGQHLPWFLEQLGSCDETLSWVMEAQVEGAALVRRMLGKCFNPDPKHDDESEES